jgi:hypothetical protein
LLSQEMPDTLEAPSISPRATAPIHDRASQPEPWTLRLFVRTHPWWASSALLVAASFALVLWARTRPSFDAYGWLVWGHQTLAGSLNTNAAPSWKPLPYVFTVPYALFGHYELWLWMITSVAISLAGAIFAGRIAYRLAAGAPPTLTQRRRWAGLIAGVFAAAALLGIQRWWHYMLSAQSDTMIAALCLAAIDRHLSGQPRWAFVLGTLASLGRPEVWPFLGLYSIWAWRAIPAMRGLIGVSVVAIVLLWFGVPALTSRTPFISASNAFGSGRRLHSHQVMGTVRRFLDLHQTSLEVAALLSLCSAVARRDWGVLTLAGAAVLWVIIEIAFALHGWPALGRYMYGAVGLMVVVAAVLMGRLVGDLAIGWLGVLLAAALVGSLVPAAISRVRLERSDLRTQRFRTTQIDRLFGALDRLGGPTRLSACGEPLTHLEYQTVLAWTLHVNVASVGFRYARAIQHGNPVVFYTPIPAGGWRVHALHQRSPACLTLPR